MTVPTWAWATRPLTVVTIAGPALASLLLIYGLLGSSLFDFVPASDDEMYYWHQTNTLSQLGFGGGYYTYEEQPAAWSVSRFGAHGPFYLMVYGALGRLFGWRLYSAPLFNLALVTLALAGLVRITRPSMRQLAWLSALLLTFWPLAWELISNMQEAVHQALAIWLAAAAYHALRKPGPRPVISSVLFVGGMFFISLMRPFWIFLLLPFGLLCLRRVTPRAVLTILAACGAAMFAVLVTVTYISAPYPNFIRVWLPAVIASRRAGLQLLLNQLRHYGAGLFQVRQSNQLLDLARFEFLFLLLALSVGVGIAWWRSRRDRQAGLVKAAGRQPDDLFHVYSMGSLFLTVLALYDPLGYPGFRLYAPYLLMTQILLVLHGRYWLVGILIAVNVLATPIFLENYSREKARNFSYDHAVVSSVRASIGDDLDYDPGAGPWANTLLLDGRLLCYDVRCDYVSAIPAGRGISLMFFPDRLQAPLKSKYLLMGDRGYAELTKSLGETLHLHWLRTTPVGDLYLNLDCACS